MTAIAYCRVASQEQLDNERSRTAAIKEKDNVEVRNYEQIKVVIYARNSVENSIDVQVEKLQKYCQSMGFEVVDVVCDKRTENRLNRLESRKVIRCARKMGAKLIVIENISRISHKILIINRFLTGYRNTTQNFVIQM